MKKLLNLFVLLISMSGFVVKHATVLRTLVMTAAFLFSIYLGNSALLTAPVAVWFYVLSTAAYIGFLYMVLPENGLRHWIVRRWGGEQQGYLVYEAVLGFLFFVNGAAIGYMSVAFAGSLPLFIEEAILRPVAAFLFVIGWVVKIWATNVAGIDIYYWKDMFLGRKISRFVADGPYRFIHNPMYGVGQLQSYAVALWYQSWPGLLAALAYQLLVFSFYYLEERKFIANVYQKKTYQHAA